jgi:endoglucanase
MIGLMATLQVAAQNPSGSPVALHGALRTKGNRIVGSADTAISLAGNSLFFTQWGGEFYNASLIKWLKDDWHSSIVRAAMGVEDTDGYLTNPATEKQKVITVVDACIAQGMYVIIDWHSQHAQDYQTQAIDFFKEMATKYGQYPNVLYEVYNEPLDTDSWSQTIKPYATAVINEIRKIDPDNLILVGTRSWDQQVVEAGNDPIKLPNIAYTLHFYVGTHGQWLRDVGQQALNNGVPLFVSEWGLWGSDTDLDNWVSFMKDNKLSWCNWSIITKDEPSSALKSGASPTGNWKSTDLTSIGTKVRNYMLNWPWNAVPCTLPTAPYLSMSIPGKIEAENYDKGCPDVSYHDSELANQGGAYRTDGVDIEACKDAGGGFNVSYIASGEWLNYTVTAANAGTYALTARVASLNGGGSFHLEVNGKNVSGTLNVPKTNDWQTWVDITAANHFSLNNGTTTLRVVIDQPLFNLNYFSLSSVVVTDIEEEKNLSTVSLYPTLSSSYFTVQTSLPILCFRVYQMNGTLVLWKYEPEGNTFTFGSSFPAGIYLAVLQTGDGKVLKYTLQKQ